MFSSLIFEKKVSSPFTQVIIQKRFWDTVSFESGFSSVMKVLKIILKGERKQNIFNASSS